MPTFIEADKAVIDMVAAVARTTYPPLVEAGVTFKCLFAVEEDGGPVLQHQGYAAAAVIRVVSHRDRVAGLADMLLVVDEHSWDHMSSAGREALIDHELCHCILVVNKTGTVKRDDCGRPKIKLRKHDFNMGGFTEVVVRHGKDALEAKVLEAAVKAWTQQTMWG